MSRRSGPALPRVDRLMSRLAALDDVAELGEGRLEDDVLTRVRATRRTAAQRLGHGTGHTVVALAGATGSGKSSLFNAVTGTEHATTGIRRPTTSSPLAAVYGDGAEGLLDWLEVPNRQRLDGGELDGLVLLDLPDHDSRVLEHRAEVDRLVEVVDVFAWVVDPQKYADAALHEGYLRRFGRHAAVTMVLLNQVDLLGEEARTGTVAHLRRLLAEDGLADVRVIPVSATTGEGVDALRRELAARVAERRAVVTRIDADVDWLATDLSSSLAHLAGRSVPGPAQEALVAAATEAAGGSQLQAAVAGSFRHRGTLAVGWPPARWLRSARPDPLSRLGLTAGRAAEVVPTTAPVAVRRTAITADPLARARLDEALRHLAQEAGSGLPPAARRAVDTCVETGGALLPDALDEAAGRTDLHLDPPLWWRVASAVQWVAAAALVAGLAWLLVLWGLAWLQFPEPPTPQWRGFPLPGLLLVTGALAGALVAVVGRRVNAVGAARRGRRARAELADRVRGAVLEHVVLPVTGELDRLTDLHRAVRRLA